MTTGRLVNRSLTLSGLVRALVFAVALLLQAACLPVRAAPPSPAAWWKFDEGSGTTAADASGNGNTGTLQSGAGWAAGLVGPFAVSVPGNSTGFVEVPQPVVDTTKSYTVMAWVKLNNAPNGSYQTFLSIDGTQVSGFYLQLRGNSNTFGLTVLPSDSTSGSPIVAQATGGVSAGTWYHIAGVYDATAQTIAFYLNGTLQQTVSDTTAWKATGHTTIGRGFYGGVKTDWVNGQIDDARVYSAALSASDINAIAQADLPPPSLQINAGQPLAQVSPTFYGMMTEEISHSYDGGLYAELIQNRTFQDSAGSPSHWSLVTSGTGTGSIALDTGQPLNSYLPVSLRLSVTSAGASSMRPVRLPIRGFGPIAGVGAVAASRVGVANDGFWGIPVQPNTSYQASFYAKTSGGSAVPLAVDIESSNGATVYAAAQATAVAATGPVNAGWQKYSATLTTGGVAPSEATRFVISASSPGTVWLDLVSLMPPTYNNRPNGNRIDLMQKLAALKQSFLRLPGGDYLEGNNLAGRFNWKNTIGPLEVRPGHPGRWGYRSSDGMGLLEFIEWCEDLHIQPVLAVYAGYSKDNSHVAPGAALQPYVQDALDEIQYVTGDTNTPWGAERAAEGHPAPFPLTYVEVGNEDNFDTSGSYNGRFTQFYDAIKAAYPALQLIATTSVSSRTPDVYDDHYYRSAAAFEGDVHHYDNTSRTGPKVFVGEWASQEGRPTPDLNAGLGDAAWLTGLERNSDVVVMESYAPLFVNANFGTTNWPTNLIGYDALSSYGSPSYYVQKMFAANHGDAILGANLTGTSGIYESVTRDSARGTVFIKIVNTNGAAQTLHVTLSGVRIVAPSGKAVTLSSASPSDTNTLTDPANIVPVNSTVTGLGPAFNYTFAPYSVTVLQVQAR